MALSYNFKHHAFVKAWAFNAGRTGDWFWGVSISNWGTGSSHGCGKEAGPPEARAALGCRMLNSWLWWWWAPCHRATSVPGQHIVLPWEKHLGFSPPAVLALQTAVRALSCAPQQDKQIPYRDFHTGFPGKFQQLINSDWLAKPAGPFIILILKND